MRSNRIRSREISVRERMTVKELVAEVHRMSMEMTELLMEYEDVIRKCADDVSDDSYRAVVGTMLTFIDEEISDGEKSNGEKSRPDKGSDEDPGDDREVV